MFSNQLLPNYYFFLCTSTSVGFFSLAKFHISLFIGHQEEILPSGLMSSVSSVLVKAGNFLFGMMIRSCELHRMAMDKGKEGSFTLWSNSQHFSLDEMTKLKAKFKFSFMFAGLRLMTFNLIAMDERVNFLWKINLLLVMD